MSKDFHTEKESAQQRAVPPGGSMTWSYVALNLTSFFILSACSSMPWSSYTKEEVVYKTADSIPLTAEIYRPKSEGLKPAVVVVHGGGWDHRSGDMSGICKDLASQGFVAFNITYRLAPDHHFPKALEDVNDSIVWLRQHAKAYNVDPEKISGWGYSAGAHLILLAGLDPSVGLRGIVAGGTPADLTAWPQSPIVEKFIGFKSTERPDLWEQASPVFHVSEQSPPVFMYHGENDDTVEPDQMGRMVKAMEAKGRHVETYTVPYFGHILVYLFSQKSIDLGIEFLKKMTTSKN